MGRTSCRLRTSTSCSRATRSSAFTSADPSHTLEVITTSRGPLASGRGPATARGSTAANSPSMATPASSATRQRRSTSARITGSGDVSAAYGVNAISATHG